MKFTDSFEFSKFYSYVLRIEWIEKGQKYSQLSIKNDQLGDVLIAIEMLNKGVTDFKIIESNFIQPI